MLYYSVVVGTSSSPLPITIIIYNIGIRHFRNNSVIMEERGGRSIHRDRASFFFILGRDNSTVLGFLSSTIIQSI